MNGAFEQESTRPCQFLGQQQLGTRPAPVMAPPMMLNQVITSQLGCTSSTPHTKRLFPAQAAFIYPQSGTMTAQQGLGLMPQNNHWQCLQPRLAALPCPTQRQEKKRLKDMAKRMQDEADCERNARWAHKMQEKKYQYEVKRLNHLGDEAKREAKRLGEEVWLYEVKRLECLGDEAKREVKRLGDEAKREVNHLGNKAKREAKRVDEANCEAKRLERETKREAKRVDEAKREAKRLERKAKRLDEAKREAKRLEREAKREAQRLVGTHRPQRVIPRTLMMIH